MAFRGRGGFSSGGRGGSSRGGSSFGAGGRGGARGGFSSRGGAGGRGGFRGGRGGGGGGGGFTDYGPPEYVVELGSFMHPAEGEMVYRSTNEKVPYFNAPVFLENKTPVGKVDEIFGPTTEMMFTVKPIDGVVATSFQAADKVYIAPDKLLPMSRFLPPAPGEKRPGDGSRGGRGGARGGGSFGASRGGGGGSFFPRGRGGAPPRGGGGGGRGGSFGGSRGGGGAFGASRGGSSGGFGARGGRGGF